VKTFSQQELDQLLAPIALYPDSLLAQILMASTYPLDIVVADRWVKANPSLKDKALQDALQQQPWDASVKSLTVFPQVLTMMSEKLDWTQKLGDAFLAQQQDLLATAQALRSKAVAQGALKDSEQQKVVTETQNNTTYIRIEPSNPEVVYVPTYDPTVVYGAWPYPAYPPYYWYPPAYYYPPGYVWGGAMLGFTAGVIVGAALWGNLTWGGGDININANRYNNFNRSNISDGKWKHNADRRGAVPYRDQNVAQQHGRGRAGDARSRDAFRGRAESGRQAIQRGDLSSRDFGSRTPAANARDPADVVLRVAPEISGDAALRVAPGISADAPVRAQVVIPVAAMRAACASPLHSTQAGARRLVTSAVEVHRVGRRHDRRAAPAEARAAVDSEAGVVRGGGGGGRGGGGRR
jgi:hypothetical protein